MRRMLILLSIGCVLFGEAAVAEEFPEAKNWRSNIVEVLQTSSSGEWRTVTAVPPEAEKRCIKLNNLFCIKNGNSRWDGSIEEDKDQHAYFSHPVYSIRAVTRTLRTYWYRHRLRTALEFVVRYAPPDDCIGGSVNRNPDGTCKKYNEPCGYAAFLASRLGLSINDRVPLFPVGGDTNTPFDISTLSSIIQAKLRFETRLPAHLRIDPAFIARAIELEAMDLPETLKNAPATHLFGVCQVGRFVADGPRRTPERRP